MMRAQRLRLTFARGDEAKELSHLEVMRALERAMREAGLPPGVLRGPASDGADIDSSTLAGRRDFRLRAC